MSEIEGKEDVTADNIDIADDILELTRVAETEEEADKVENTASDKDEKKNIFRKFKIRDIVFLAIVTACSLVTGAVMPFVSGVPIFGIIQLCLGLQFSIFPVIGMMKVRKPCALLLQSVFISVFLVFMFPPMTSVIVCALMAEGLTLLIFRGYKSDWACVFASTLYMPLTIPMLFALYAISPSIGKGKAAEQMFIAGNANPWMIVGMTVAVIAICFAGSVVGMLIARELRKSGKLK